MSFVCDNSISDILTANYLLYGRNLRLEIQANDGKILNVVRQDILWKKIVFESIPESPWSLDDLKDQRTLKLDKVAVQVRLGDTVVIQENVVPHHR